MFDYSDLNFILNLHDLKFINIDFKRGLGIIEDRFILDFVSNNNLISIEVETNIRIRDDKSIYLSFNDLYIDKNRKELSVRRYRSQKAIEKTYLSIALEYINQTYKNDIVNNIIIKEYGDLYIYLSNNVVIEIFNDTHLDNAVLYRIFQKIYDKINQYEVTIIKDSITITKS